MGNGADSTFGGMDKLLSRDWDYEAFVQRYTFIDPAAVLKKSKNPEAAKAFLKYLQGADAMKIFEGVGFSKVS